MKKFIFITGTLLLLVSLSLTACGSKKEEASVVDKQIYNSAIETSNLELCTTINNNALKNDCNEVIASNHLANEAIKTKDLNKCKQIKNDQIKKSCKIQVNTQLAEDAKKVEEQKQAVADKGKMQKLQDTLDFDGCYDLKTEYLQKECVINVATSIAESEGNTEYCNKIGNKSLQENCLNAGK